MNAMLLSLITIYYKTGELVLGAILHGASFKIIAARVQPGARVSEPGPARGPKFSGPSHLYSGLSLHFEPTLGRELSAR